MKIKNHTIRQSRSADLQPAADAVVSSNQSTAKASMQLGTPAHRHSGGRAPVAGASTAALQGAKATPWSSKPHKPARCRAITTAGKRCRNRAMAGRRCAVHGGKERLEALKQRLLEEHRRIRARIRGKS